MELTNNVMSTVYYVGIENELRFVVGEEKTVTLELLSGFAEIFGSELVQNTVYTFPPYSSISLFTWQGCSVKLGGKVIKAHVSSETLIMISVNIHACLEEMRIRAETRNRKGPISLVVGPTQSGKSSFCRLLLNYAARLGRKTLYIDLDVSQNPSSIPGAISILPVEKPSHITSGFIRQALSVFAFGYRHPRKNTAFYFLLIKKLGEMLQKRLGDANPNIRSSGVIIDTCSWVRGKGYVALTLAAYAFEIDVVFVIEDEKLFKQLRIDMPSSVKVVYVPKQEGVFERNSSLRLDIQANRIWEYFYGSVKEPLNPYEFDVKFSDIKIYRASSNSSVANAFNISVSDIRIVNVSIRPELVNSVLGLSFANVADENLLVTNVKGFICIINIDMDKEVVTVLSPQPGPLPSKVLIMGDIKLKRINT